PPPPPRGGGGGGGGGPPPPPRPASAAPVPAPAPAPPSAPPPTAQKPEPPKPTPEPEPPVRQPVVEVAAEPPPAKPKRPRHKAEPTPKAHPKPRTAHRQTMPAAAVDEPAAGEIVYKIRFTPGPDVLKRGVNLLGVFDELRELGKLDVQANIDAVPTLSGFEPERSYLSWTCTLRTTAEPDRLDDVFLFVAEDGAISVERRLADGAFEAVETPLLKLPPGTPVATPPSTIPRPTPPPPAPAVQSTTAHPGEAPHPKPSEAADAINGQAKTAHAARAHGRIRVDAQQLDDLVGLAGELAVISDNLQGLREIRSASPWVATIESLLRVSREIRDTTLDLRMVPVDELFSRFPRFVRDQADRTGKEIDLRIVGQETRLDRTIVERLGDPMVHLIRNAVDHALETPEEREAMGKPRVGRITLSAGHEGDRVAIKVEDDGRGLDRERIVRKGVERGLIPPGTPADDPRVVSLIFEPGFSTRDQVSELSGRGVGLDVVRDSVRALRGSLAVESEPGQGTSFIFRLPLTLALIDGLLIETGGGRYVVPLAQVEECVALGGVQQALSAGRPCVTVRGELVPTVSLRNLFGIDGPPPPRQELLLTRHSGRRVGVAVDRLSGRVQAVIQSLGEGLHSLSRFSGATILGDGSVSLILDLSALVSESRIAESHSRNKPAAGVWAENVR
ncbi:chemotaxis protein CheA, partial [Paludisphaera rhizosphaerae]|uniref:chemotaxis protein CheA n=1 Tax=Paludisphaera rhizosphaerae TaxID=2711216 RepID=UPI001C6E7E6E